MSEVDTALAMWREEFPRASSYEPSTLQLTVFIEALSLPAVLDAMAIASRRHYGRDGGGSHARRETVSYFYGVCRGKQRDAEKAKP